MGWKKFVTIAGAVGALIVYSGSCISKTRAMNQELAPLAKEFQIAVENAYSEVNGSAYTHLGVQGNEDCFWEDNNCEDSRQYEAMKGMKKRLNEIIEERDQKISEAGCAGKASWVYDRDSFDGLFFDMDGPICYNVF